MIFGARCNYKVSESLMHAARAKEFLVSSGDWLMTRERKTRERFAKK